MCHHHVSQNYTHGSCWDLFIIFTVAELPFETMPLQAVDTLSEQDTQFQCLFITCQPSNYLSAHYCLSTWVLKIIQCLMLFSAHLSPIVPLIASSNLPRLGLSQFRRRPASDVAFRRSAWVLVWIHLEGGSSPKVWWEPWRWCLASSPPMVLATTSMDPLWNQVGLLDATNAINHNFLKLLPHVMSFVFSVVAWGSQTTKKGQPAAQEGKSAVFANHSQILRMYQQRAEFLAFKSHHWHPLALHQPRMLWVDVEGKQVFLIPSGIASLNLSIS